MDLKGEGVARTQRWWRRVFSCGFAHRSPRNDKLCNLFLGRICIPPFPQAPYYHPGSRATDTQVDAGPSSWLRLRTFAKEVLPEPKPGNCIPFHSISAEEDWSSDSVRSVPRGRGSTVQGRQWKQRQERLNSYERNDGANHARESEMCCIMGWFTQPYTGKGKHTHMHPWAPWEISCGSTG